jgi:hypothetical protein
VVGQFAGNRGEFFDQEDFKGRAILVRYDWLNLLPTQRVWRSHSRLMVGRLGK